MKRKYYATIIIVIILVSVSAGTVRLSNSLGMRHSTSPSLIKPDHQVSASVPGSETIKEMKRLKKIMPRLMNPSESDSSEAQLGLFGYYTFGGKAIRTTGEKPELSSQMDYSLSLAFWGNKKRCCVIDDRFYVEGASLPDGWTIVRVELNRVLIKKKKLTKWITLKKQTDIINNTEQSGDKM